MKLFSRQDFFSKNLISKLGVKMNLRTITKIHAADQEITLRTKSLLNPYGLTRPSRERGS